MLTLFVLLGVVYAAYHRLTRAGGPIYDRSLTASCLRSQGFKVTGSTIPDEPEHRDIYVSRTANDDYPRLLFFERRGQARDYARGDSVPLIRRGNVVVDAENYGHSAESLPDVKAVTACLRPQAAT